MSRLTSLLSDEVGHTVLSLERSGDEEEVGARGQREREEERRAEQTGAETGRLQ